MPHLEEEGEAFLVAVQHLIVALKKCGCSVRFAQTFCDGYVRIRVLNEMGLCQ